MCNGRYRDRFVIVVLTFAISGFVHGQTLTPGDYGSFSFPVSNYISGGIPMRGVRIEIAQTPSWLIIETNQSHLGPFDIEAGGEVIFRVSYTIGTDVGDSDGKVNATFIIKFDNSETDGFSPAQNTWNLTSEDVPNIVEKS